MKLYHSNEARKSAIKRISELIKVISEIPTGNIGGYQNVSDIFKFLVDHKELIKKELKENGGNENE